MHLRRVACILLGAWLAGAIVIGWMATVNFAAADRVLSAPPAQIQKAMAPLDPNQSRMILRFLVATENADYFLRWEMVEFTLLLLVAAVLAADRQTRWLAIAPVVLVVVVAFQHYRITPEIVWLGENMVRGIATGSQRDEFAAMHRIYGIMEVFKLLCGLALAVWLVMMKVRRRRSSSAEGESKAAVDRRYAT